MSHPQSPATNGRRGSAASAGEGPGGLPRPVAAGPLSELVLELIFSAEAEAPAAEELASEAERLAGTVADPLSDDDLQLALYLCYELHYRSFAGVEGAWEWSPALLALRRAIERRFFDALERSVRVPADPDPAEVGDLLFRMEADDEGVSFSRRVELEVGVEEFRELVVHRSLFQLKEADPHSWAIPRLTGAAKTALLEVQIDEYGGGHSERMHSRLFAKTMRALGLDSRENAYLDHVPGEALATVNLMSGLGLKQSRRGAIAGHLAMFEMTSSRPSRRYANALRRLGYGEDATDFYDEHVEADAVHENIAAYDLAGGLAREEPALAGDILFGAAALLQLEDQLGRRVLEAWAEGRTSLRRSLAGGLSL